MTDPVTRRPLSRRRRQILWAAALVIVTAVTAGALLRREPAETYRPGEQVEGLTSDLTRELHAGATRPHFVDVADDAGVTFRHFGGVRSSQLPEDMGSGVAWGDVDDDGLPDLFLVNITASLDASAEQASTSTALSRLYINLGDGRFRDATDEAGVGVRGIGQGAAFGDVDSDGDLDLVVTTWGPIHLFLNDGAGRFEEQSDAWGLSGFKGFWTGPTFFDFDRDGRLDLYVCGYVQYREDEALRTTAERQYRATVPASLNPSSFEPERNLLFHNRGDTFAEVAEERGVANTDGRSLSAAAADLDDDGWPDLYVANDISDNVLYRNRGDGHFDDMSHAALVADYRGAMGLAVADWDDDTDLDIFVSHWVAQENALYVNTRAETDQPPGAPLRFADAADMNGIGQPSIPFVGWGTSFFDYDLDGRLDLFVVNGHTIPRSDDPSRLQPMRAMLYWNGGAFDGYFDVAETDRELAREVVARGAALADYDRDGDLDLVINVQGGPARLLRNDTATGRSVTLRLRSADGNRFAVGARVTATLGDRLQTRELGAQSSYLSQNVVGEETFGLGDAEQLDHVSIRWPSGLLESAGPFAAGQIVTWHEGTPPAGPEAP